MSKITLIFVLFFALILSSCGKKEEAKQAPTPTVTKRQKVTIVQFENPPQVSLTPRTDGRELNMTISKIPVEVKKIEYEVIYKAKDGKTEIEKGLGDTISNVTPTIERKLLLGTSSCTNGCKYRYDEGVTGGTIKVTYLTENNEVNIYENNWTLSKSGGKFLVNLDK